MAAVVMMRSLHVDGQSLRRAVSASAKSCQVVGFTHRLRGHGLLPSGDDASFAGPVEYLSLVGRQGQRAHVHASSSDHEH